MNLISNTYKGPHIQEPNKQLLPTAPSNSMGIKLYAYLRKEEF